MSMDVICPSCGFRNPPGQQNCDSCNYPLGSLASRPEHGGPSSGETRGVAGAPAYEAPRRELRRPQRRGAPMQGQSMWLWLLFGTVAAAVLIWTAIDANRKRAVESRVEGSNPAQQTLADAARTALAADSTNVEAHLTLANVLYDTGNWSEAIVHYRTVLRRDPARVPAMVDLGVCYYNLGETKRAEELFQQAVKLDPHQAVALFNLGIVNERHGDVGPALQYYRRALDSAPTDELKSAIEAAIQRTSPPAAKPPSSGSAPRTNTRPGGK